MKEARETEDKQLIYGIIKVGSKGQIAIPVDLRNRLGIKEGDQLLAARRSDNKGIVLLKMDEFEKMLERFPSPPDNLDI